MILTNSTLHYFLICFLIIIGNSLSTLNAQALFTDTLSENTNDKDRLIVSNNYYSWLENNSSNNEKRLYRGMDNTIESQVISSTYNTCGFARLNMYNDFVYAKIEDLSNLPLCDVGFVWGTNGTLAVDEDNLDFIDSQYEHLFFNDNRELIDITNGNRMTFNLSSADCNYSISNIISIRDLFIYFKVFRRDKITNSFKGQAIVKYNRQTGNHHEIFVSENSLHFFSEGSQGEDLIFSESSNISLDSTKFYYHDGNQNEFFLKRYVTNQLAKPFMDGVIYVASDSLFYWERDKDLTFFISDEVFRIVVEENKVAWFSGFGANAQLNFYDGSTSEAISFSGHPDEYSLNFLAEDNILFLSQDLDGTEEFVVKGNHNLNNPISCTYPNSQISDGRSYFRVDNLTSDATLDRGLTHYRATGTIQLLPGFHAGKNKEFHAEIINCTSSLPFERNVKTNEGIQALEHHLSKENVFIAQNSPNPFYSGTTSIRYSIPTRSKFAQITVLNAWGQSLAKYPINSNGSGVLELPIGGFSKGLYYYTLEVDGEIIDTKKMISFVR